MSKRNNIKTGTMLWVGAVLANGVVIILVQYGALPDCALAPSVVIASLVALVGGWMSRATP